MIKKILPVALLGIALISQSACNAKNKGFQKTKRGLVYKIVKDAPGDHTPKVGDFVEMNIHLHFKDSTLFDSRKMNNNEPVPFQIQAPAFNGDPQEGFMMMTPGDSAVILVSVDSLKKHGMQLLPGMKEGDTLEYDVVLVSVKTADQMKKEAEEKAAAQKGTDDKILQDYFAKNNIHPQKTADGLYYTIEKEGTGATPTAGQTVTVNYTGKTMDGKTFDSNVDPEFKHTQPFSFTLGRHQVIEGWDEGVALLKKGSQATLYIPSPMAYGAHSPSPAIPANSILIFNIEVTDIK